MACETDFIRHYEDFKYRAEIQGNTFSDPVLGERFYFHHYPGETAAVVILSEQPKIPNFIQDDEPRTAVLVAGILNSEPSQGTSEDSDFDYFFPDFLRNRVDTVKAMVWVTNGGVLLDGNFHTLHMRDDGAHFKLNYLTRRSVGTVAKATMAEEGNSPVRTFSHQEFEQLGLPVPPHVNLEATLSMYLTGELPDSLGGGHLTAEKIKQPLLVAAEYVQRRHNSLD